MPSKKSEKITSYSLGAAYYTKSGTLTSTLWYNAALLSSRKSKSRFDVCKGMRGKNKRGRLPIEHERSRVWGVILLR
jgi:hypothetical protein